MSVVDDTIDSLLKRPPKPGAWRIPYGDDGIIRTEPDDEEVSESRGKLTFRDACYTASGPMPFVCGTCSSFDDGECERVSGPYEGGLVLEGDTCVLWEPAANLTKGGGVQGDDESEDTVPAMLSPKEYVLTPEQVDELGGEERLEALR